MYTAEGFDCDPIITTLAPISDFETATAAWDPLAKSNIGTLVLSSVTSDSHLRGGIKLSNCQNIHSLPESPYERKSAAQEMLERGIMPRLGNGFQFVIDRRPEGQEHRSIPSTEYTAYFSQRKVPIADADHKEREHDLGHIPTFQDMFGYTPFADLVQRAASSSVGNMELCKAFTGTMDQFGDELRNLDEMSNGYYSRARFRRSSFVNGARSSLLGLIQLGRRNSDGELIPYAERGELFERVWLALGLHAHDLQAQRETALSVSQPEDWDEWGHEITSYGSPAEQKYVFTNKIFSDADVQKHKYATAV